MGGQQHEVVDSRVVEGQLVEMQREGLVILDGDADDSAIKLAVADGAGRVSSNLIGEQHILGGHRRTVAPARVGADGEGDVDPLLAVGQVDRNSATTFDRWK